jgi:hypothetical protein
MYVLYEKCSLSQVVCVKASSVVKLALQDSYCGLLMHILKLLLKYSYKVY